ncbi:O-methyltransferase [Vibrio splendidus]|uniref:O-methyltransferase n=1 Tax=Vibrio splendidus TaxID=29497 RepID=UPI00223601C1|nr:class I SAM-dependent methyltransferase [Vibrio splendidus]MCW4438903.1 class I SAM-dependent methyltransferase [Vibrio splendidus]MCW4444180.1 class I SAM-dependent methyltransferase [Vibrio splendidus]
MKYLNFTDALNQYVTNHNNQDDELLSTLREVTYQKTGRRMMISSDQAQFLRTLLALYQPKNVLEIGVFTGYSSTVIARSIPSDAHITACDINEEWTTIAKEYWQRADVIDKISLLLGDASQTLTSLIETGNSKSFDLVFIDADKVNYDTYYEKSYQLLKSGGVIIIDNVLWKGTVAQPERHDKDISALRQLNDKVAKDTRVESTLLPIGDGMLLIVKK